MDFKHHLETAWNLTQRYIVPLLLMTLVLVVGSIITFGILTPFIMAGYMQSLLMTIRSGREPKVQDIFSEMRLLLPLLGFGIGVVIVLKIGFSLLILPGIIMFSALIFTCLYMLPLMTDRNFNLIDAVKESYKMTTGEDLMDHLIGMILFIGITTIGCLFTLPLSTIFILSIYEEKMNGGTPAPPTEPPPSAPPEEPAESADEWTIKDKF